MIVIPPKNEKQILVICLIEQHKDNNDRSGKKSPNLYSPDHAYAWAWVVPCGSSPVAHLYRAKSEAPEEEAGLQT